MNIENNAGKRDSKSKYTEAVSRTGPSQFDAIILKSIIDASNTIRNFLDLIDKIVSILKGKFELGWRLSLCLKVFLKGSVEL